MLSAANNSVNPAMACVFYVHRPLGSCYYKTQAMESVFHYHTLKEAEEIRRTYCSWISKRAHSGLGKQEYLRDIVIKPGNRISVGGINEQGYYLEFIFENRVLNVYEFTVSNGLMPITGTLSVAEIKRQVASEQRDRARPQ